MRFTDIDGHRFTCLATDAKKASLRTLSCGTGGGHAASIRNAKDTGLRNLPLKGFDQNQLWCEIVALACELTTWTQMLALAGPPPPGTQATAPVRLRAAWPAAAVVRGFASASAGPGPPISLPRLPGCSPFWLTVRNSLDGHEGETTRPVEPRPPGATTGQLGTAAR